MRLVLNLGFIGNCALYHQTVLIARIYAIRSFVTDDLGPWKTTLNVLLLSLIRISLQLQLRAFWFQIDSLQASFHYNRTTEKEADMNYIELAEMSAWSTIVFGMMRISRVKTRRLIEAALSVGINTFRLSGYLWRWPVWGPLCSSSVGIYGTRCGSSPSVGFAKTVLRLTF